MQFYGTASAQRFVKSSKRDVGPGLHSFTHGTVKRLCKEKDPNPKRFTTNLIITFILNRCNSYPGIPKASNLGCDLF